MFILYTFPGYPINFLSFQRQRLEDSKLEKQQMESSIKRLEEEKEELAMVE